MEETVTEVKPPPTFTQKDAIRVMYHNTCRLNAAVFDLERKVVHLKEELRLAELDLEVMRREAESAQTAHDFLSKKVV